MSESLDGVSFTITRQNAGSVANTVVALALARTGGVNAPARTESADRTCPSVTVICASDSHATGAGAAPVDASSVAADSVQLPETPFSLAYANVWLAAHVMTTAPPTT